MDILTVIYLGRTKERPDGSRTAKAWDGNGWAWDFPEKVLRQWFEGIDTSTPAQENNLYAVIGAKPNATADEIKAAYRRMARQWHPDVCKERNAHEVFIRIGEAYKILSDIDQRARYDVGLELARRVQPSRINGGWAVKQLDDNYGYRSPLRCGYVLAEVSGRLVTQIHQWEDITQDGKTLVTSWVYGDKQPTVRWI